MSTDEVIFPLTVSLDRLPPGTPKAKVRLARGGAVVLIQTPFLRLGWLALLLTEVLCPLLSDCSDCVETGGRGARGQRSRLLALAADPISWGDLPGGAERFQGPRWGECGE